MPSPDASSISEERFRNPLKGCLKGFPRIRPDFVIELRSETPIEELNAKMHDWIASGAPVAWLTDPPKRQVHVFRPNHASEVVTASEIDADGPNQGVVLDLSGVWKCYED